jgi:hypothetical protein
MDTKDATEIQPVREINYREIGRISKETKKTVTDAITEVFKRKGFKGELPEAVSISQGAVVLPSGEEIEACYNFDTDNPGKPGKILVSAEKSKSAFGDSAIPIEVATAAFAAHEAVEHINYITGEKLLTSSSKIPVDEHATSNTEKEANSIAREVIEDLYGWTVYFGDETPPPGK